MIDNTNNKIAAALYVVADSINKLDAFEEADGKIQINSLEEWLQLALLGYETTTGVAKAFGKEVVFTGNVGKLVQIIIELLSDLKKQNAKTTA